MNTNRNCATFKNDLIVALLDGEALFTIIGGVKPCTWINHIQDELRAEYGYRFGNSIKGCVERIAAALGMEYRHYTHPGAPIEHFAVFIDRTGFDSMMGQHGERFARRYRGISKPSELFLAAWNEENQTARNRSLGYLFGYPTYAVKYVAENGVGSDFPPMETKRKTPSLREYRSAGWGTPAGEPEREIDHQLHAALEAARAKYTALRKQAEDATGTIDAAKLLSIIRAWRDSDDFVRFRSIIPRER